jgi:hypothetical protein
MKTHRRGWRHHEIEREAQRPFVGKGRRQSARGKNMFAHESEPHEAAGGMRLELQKPADILRTQVSARVHLAR